MRSATANGYTFHAQESRHNMFWVGVQFIRSPPAGREFYLWTMAAHCSGQHTISLYICAVHTYSYLCVYKMLNNLMLTWSVRNIGAVQTCTTHTITRRLLFKLDNIQMARVCAPIYCGEFRTNCGFRIGAWHMHEYAIWEWWSSRWDTHVTLDSNEPNCLFLESHNLVSCVRAIVDCLNST